MFTGIVVDTWFVKVVELLNGGGLKLVLQVSDKDEFFSSIKIGDSISVSGACLTVVSKSDDGLVEFFVSDETISKTNLGLLKFGDKVNIELAMGALSRFDGHMVSGHIDEVASVVSVKKDGGGMALCIKIPAQSMSLVVKKGSITLNGVSLTINNVNEEFCTLEFFIIPHTLEVTTLKFLDINSIINVEYDIIVKYISKMIKNYQL